MRRGNGNLGFGRGKATYTCCSGHPTRQNHRFQGDSPAGCASVTLERVCPLLETAVTQEYHEIVSQLDALRLLGTDAIRAVLNVSCNYAACVALQQAELLPA